ncbi:hypothetical protein H5410_044321 [Solanum commersonii]|uniref:Uncharacterized protein n=1 Tax=Solanum commersonii TaxID=4109 RepID=A0A9J5X857_SOLCO|nr:hypothetical protein H5410_044321 [Solanum commersonii]
MAQVIHLVQYCLSPMRKSYFDQFCSGCVAYICYVTFSFTSKGRRETRGLGIKNLRVQNKSLLSKWLWRLVVDYRALWRRLILHKYGQNEECMSNAVDSMYRRRNLTFKRNPNDWEVDRIVQLLLRLGEFTGLTIKTDGIRWKHDPNGMFSRRVCLTQEKHKKRGFHIVSKCFFVMRRRKLTAAYPTL